MGGVVEVAKAAFTALISEDAVLEKLWSGGKWLEGPVWFPEGGYLLFSDIPNNLMLRYDEAEKSTSVFRDPSNNSNGNTLDAQGRLVTCEQLKRRVVRMEKDGSKTIIADQYNGKKLNSPNDVVVDSKGCIWFTDPTYGIDSDYEGKKADPEIGSNNVYCWDANTRALTAVITTLVMPNGLAFSPDEKSLYVADSGCTLGESGPYYLWRFPVMRVSDQESWKGEIISTCSAGFYDGFRIDHQGNIWTSSFEGVHCLTPDGDLLGKIKVPEKVANVCFGGADKKCLFICASTSLYAIDVKVAGNK